MTNRTPTEVIASVEQWASHIITQPNDPMRKDVAAVLAMARAGQAFQRMWTLAPTSSVVENQKLFRAKDNAVDAMDSALSAAGVGGGE